MKIESAVVAMQGSSDYKRTEFTTVTAVRTMSVATMTLDELEQSGLLEPEDTLTLGEEDPKAAGLYSPRRLSGTGSFGDWQNELRAQLIRAFLQALQNGSRSSQFSDLIDSLRTQLRLEGFQDGLHSGDNLSRLWDQLNGNTFGNRPISIDRGADAVWQPTFNVVNSSSYIRVSRETFIENSMSFSTVAQVKTSDGRLIDIDLQLNMSQSFYEKLDFEALFSNTTVTEIVLKDPLVINLDIPSAMLGNTKFEFDLDCDGETDQISRLANGSGFLAYDIHGDGVIRDGSQLFGALTGNGFAELAMHDKDGNGWIDENDCIFDKLRVWLVNDDGTHSLFALGELGIGAIFLGSVETDYVLGSLNDPDGYIRRTGFFLYEDGRAGTIQHVDLRV